MDIDKNHHDYIEGFERGVFSATQLLSDLGVTVEQSVKAQENEDEDAELKIVCVCRVRGDDIEQLKEDSERGQTFWDGFEAGVESCGCCFDATCPHFGENIGREAMKNELI